MNPYMENTPGYVYFGDVSPESYGGAWIGIHRTNQYDGNVGHIIKIITSNDLEDLSDNRCLIQTGYVYLTFKRLMQAKREIRENQMDVSECSKEHRRGLLLDMVRLTWGFDLDYSYTCKSSRLAKNVDRQVK